MEDVAHNAVMFGAFHGMGKFVDDPLKRLVFRDFEATSALGKVAFQGSRDLLFKDKINDIRNWLTEDTEKI